MESILRNQAAIWFQLTKTRVTTFLGQISTIFSATRNKSTTRPSNRLVLIGAIRGHGPVVTSRRLPASVGCPGHARLSHHAGRHGRGIQASAGGSSFGGQHVLACLARPGAVRPERRCGTASTSRLAAAARETRPVVGDNIGGHGQPASVLTYRAAPEALPTLLAPGSLFAWRSPAYPEDLSFSTDQGAVCLATVSHEGDAWILSPSLASAIGSKVTLVRETLNARDEQYFKPV